MKQFFLVTIVATNLFLTMPVLADSKSYVQSRAIRQTSADQMVQNILRWLQGVYTQQSRKSRFATKGNYYGSFPSTPNRITASPRLDIDAFRQGTIREYLPPTNTQKPRPFEPRPDAGDGIDAEGNFVDGGYPPAGSITPQPPFPPHTNDYPEGTSTLPPPSLPTRYPDRPGYPSTYPTTGYTDKPSYPTYPPQTYPSDRPGFPTHPPTGYTEGPSFPTHPSTGYTDRPGFPTHPSTGYTDRPGFPTQPSTGYTEHPGFPTQPSTGYTDRPGFPTHPPTARPPYVSPEYSTQPSSERPGFPTQTVTEFTGYPTAGFPTQPEVVTEQPEQPQPGPTEAEQTVRPGFSTAPPPGVEVSTPRPAPVTDEQQPEITNKFPGDITGELSTSVSVTLPPATAPSVPEGTTSPPAGPDEIPEVPNTPGEDDDKHPPHIHAIDVQCAKDMMTINIEFNREFNGIIYSKGYYSMPECRYVNENSGQVKYSFTVNLNMCGTEFINAFDTQGQSYLENVLVLQNEPAVQEVWDSVRAVRCLWEGNLKEQLSVSLMVGMLTQEIVTFSGDTAMAKLDIVLGRGPFGQPANGLVKIGEPMTLVVSVSGDPGFDIQVKDCRATDTTGSNEIQLTDDEGCILKSKLFGAFQKTRNTENTGASIIAYAYFNAFKFPDVMDIMIECNIELCKTDCEMCPKGDQPLEPAKRRRRRDLSLYNSSLHDGIVMGKHLRVILAEDLNAAKNFIDEGYCISSQNFLLSSCLLISLLGISSVLGLWLWCKSQGVKMKG